MAGAVRAFQGLNGSELRQILQQELLAAVGGDTRFQGPDPLKIAWTWTLTLEQYPAAPAQLVVVVSGSVMAPSGAVAQGKIVQTILDTLARDQRFALHLAFPRLTWDWRLQADFQAVPEALRPSLVVDTPMGDPWAEARRARGEGSETGLRLREEQARLVDPRGQPIASGAADAFVTDAHGNRFRLVPVDVEGQPTPLETASVGRQPEPMFRTGTGLPITGEALPSPGAALAHAWGGGSDVGAIQTSAPEAYTAHAEIGVSHPSLAEGGVGSPDALRRAANLVVPMPQKGRTSSSIVDLPSGTF